MRGVLMSVTVVLFLSPLIELLQFQRLGVIVTLETLNVEFLEDRLHSCGLNTFHTDLRAEERCQSGDVFNEFPVYGILFDLPYEFAVYLDDVERSL